MLITSGVDRTGTPLGLPFGSDARFIPHSPDDAAILI
jgi:hypothetical protein